MLVGEWGKWRKCLKTLKDRNWEPAVFSAAGQWLSGEIKKAIKAKVYKPNHPFTVLLKSTSSGVGDQPLVDHGQLIKSVGYKVHKLGTDSQLFVGIEKSKRNKDGKSLAQIALIVHDGASITVTPKMRAFLHAAGAHLKPSTSTLLIPPRPFISSICNDPKRIEAVKIMYLKGLVKAVKGGA